MWTDLLILYLGVLKVRHTSYLEVLQSVLVENVFNIHGLLASLLGAALKNKFAKARKLRKLWVSSV